MSGRLFQAKISIWIIDLVKQIVSSMCLDNIQSTKSLNRTKDRARENELAVWLLELGDGFSAALWPGLTPLALRYEDLRGLERIRLTLQISGLWASTGSTPLVFLGLQLADSRPWGVSASIVTEANSLQWIIFSVDKYRCREIEMEMEIEMDDRW